MDTAKALIDKIGRKEICDAIGIKLGAVSAAAVAGEIPPRWYKEVKFLADQKGIDCPMELFAWKHANTPTGEVA